MLQAAMPQINCKINLFPLKLSFKILLHLALVCGATECLQFLCQRTAGLTNLQTLQSAVLALFYYAHTRVQDEE